MDNISNSSFYENLIIIYTKKLFFLIFFIFSYLFIYFLLNFLIQVSSPQKNQFLLSLNNNQRDILTNYFFIKNINDNFDESIKNEILKSNLPQINAEKIIAKLSLSFNSSYLHFLENSIKYSFYLENNINYLNDYKAINKNLTIIEEFFSIKDSVFIFNYERFEEKIMRIKVFVKNTENFEKNQETLIHFLNLVDEIFKKQLKFAMSIIIEDYRMLLKNKIFSDMEDLKAEYNRNLLKIDMFQNFVINEKENFDLDKIPFYYDNEHNKLHTKIIEKKIQTTKLMIEKINNNKIDLSVSDEEYLSINFNEEKISLKQKINIFKINYNIIFIAFLFSFFISVFIVISLNSFQKYLKKNNN